jgi:hypothetical protein
MPTGGPVQFAVLAGRTGSDPVLWRMAPGAAASASVDGLDPHINYCFVVAAVYPGAYVRARPVCTTRAVG